MIIMGRKNKHDDLIEINATKKYASVLLTPKEFRKGRKRWMDKHPDHGNN
jgi:hypothetical protein